ncbi:hypothetical protein DL95DRAFT_379177 [Leptodontidium sp. 2 PMI_412]|nr:hypothetical protein DL95DRAFT_379177 [Leptodontidium sp. 2 PMI_412]
MVLAALGARGIPRGVEGCTAQLVCTVWLCVVEASLASDHGFNTMYWFDGQPADALIPDSHQVRYSSTYALSSSKHPSRPRCVPFPASCGRPYTSVLAGASRYIYVDSLAHHFSLLTQIKNSALLILDKDQTNTSFTHTCTRKTQASPTR